jgi:hypothetical protein
MEQVAFAWERGKGTQPYENKMSDGGRERAVPEVEDVRAT